MSVDEAATRIRESGIWGFWKVDRHTAAPGEDVPYPGRADRLDYEGDYFTTANGFTIACPQIETKGALDAFDDILALDGVDMVCFGPNDLSVALTGRLDIWAKEVQDAMTLVLSKCREMSVMSLIFANDMDFAKPRIAEGWDIVAVGTDAGWFGKAAAAIRREAGGS